MAKWRKKEGVGKDLARQGIGTAKGVAGELLSIATLGLYKPRTRCPHKRSRW